MFPTLLNAKLIDILLVGGLIAAFIHPDILYIPPVFLIGALKGLDMVYNKNVGGKALDDLKEEVKTAQADVRKLSMKLGFRS